ncbi:phosphatase PAP2 family protein [Nocardia sp. NPDC059764]|uniref:phosphatase PAP2 family protein n=1 Tax=Nocardia sp. NPDC059764 TaxID=3346939 RepID=UPI00365C70A9
MPSTPPAPKETAPTSPPADYTLTGVFIASVLAAIIIALTCEVIWSHGPAGPDATWLRWFIDHRTDTWTTVAKAISAAGGTTSVAVYSTLACLFLAWRRYWDRAVLVAVTSTGAGLIVFFGKLLIGRDRPPVVDHLVTETNHSYPSGHALGSTVVIGILVVVALPWLRPVARLVLTALAALFVLAVGLSRLYLGVHWPTDVLAGWLIGACWLTICLTLSPLTRLVTDRLPGRD